MENNQNLTPKTPKLMGAFVPILNYLFGPNIPFRRVLNEIQEYGFIFEKIIKTKNLTKLVLSKVCKCLNVFECDEQYSPLFFLSPSEKHNNKLTVLR